MYASSAGILTNIHIQILNLLVIEFITLLSPFVYHATQNTEFSTIWYIKFQLKMIWYKSNIIEIPREDYSNDI